MNEPTGPLFSEDDLLPTGEDRARGRARIIDQSAATVACIAAGIVMGGMVALGACAAPMVFQLTPDPMSGFAMGAAFARFDKLAIGASCVLLGAEVVRTYLARRSRPTIASRLRRLSGIGIAGCAAVLGMWVSPTINELYLSGARRGEGEAGQNLERVHRQAERLGKLEVALAALAIGLHVFTRAARDEEAEDEEIAPSVLPPGPSD